MPSATLLTRIPRLWNRTFTFTGATGFGAPAEGNLLARVTGTVLIRQLSARCTTTLVGAGPVSLGVPLNSTAFIPSTTATTINAGDFWDLAIPSVGFGSAFFDFAIASNIILTVGATAVTAGVIEFAAFWNPISSDGNLAT